MIKSSKPIIFKVYGKSRNTPILIKILQLFVEYSHNHQIIYDENVDLNKIFNESLFYNRIPIDSLLNQNGDILPTRMDVIFNPVKKEDLIKKGLGISSKEMYDNLEFYLPKPNPIIMYKLHMVRPNIKEILIRKYPDRTLIFLEEG